MADDERDARDLVRAARMEIASGHLKIGAAALRTSVAVRRFVEQVRAAEAAQFWDHPDVLEADVAADAWYPGEVDHG